MASAARRRLLKDLQKIKNEKDDGYEAAPCEDNILLWKAVIYGPEETIWEGGTFRLQIECSEEYPTKPPVVVFKTAMYHPNIYNDGNICLDSSVLTNAVLQKEWSSFYDIAALLKSIRSLLSDPNPDSPANTAAAQLFNDNPKEYAKRVRDVVELSWTS